MSLLINCLFPLSLGVYRLLRCAGELFIEISITCMCFFFYRTSILNENHSKATGSDTRKLFIKAFLVVMVTLVNGCAVEPNAFYPPPKDKPTRGIFLVSHGWHAGIVVKRSDITQAGWPKLHTFADVDYLEIGWGDKDYYTSPDPGPGLAAKALLLPTSSVLHIVGFRGSPEAYFSNSEIIMLELSVPGYEAMVRRISKSFLRDKFGSAVALGHGNYGYSRFYASEETYHLFKTCNTWTATILKSAGLPVKPSLTVNGLMSQVRGFGEVIQEKSESQ